MNSTSASFTKIFVPKILFIGLGVLLVGVMFFGFALFRLFVAHRLSFGTFGIGFTLVAVGVLAAFKSNAEACAACREVLVDTYTIVPVDLDAQVRAAVHGAERGTIDAVVALERAPLPVVSTSVTSSVELTYCPACVKIARLASARRKTLPDGATTTHDQSAPVVLSGPSVGRVVEMIKARNEAWQKSVYGGVLPS